MLTKNERFWIAPHILRVLPFVDEMVFFDSSTDGTDSIIHEISRSHPHGKKIRLHVGGSCDPDNLQDDYVRLFDECMRTLTTDLAWYLHPDMYVVNPEKIMEVRQSQAIALSCKMRSFAGDPGAQLYEIKGRGESWKNIYRLKNPDLGAHYFGHYGHADEDVYFQAITGKRHEHHGQNFSAYPYVVEDSGLEILHFSDVRTLQRRTDRMIKCLLNNGIHRDKAEKRAASHPRVTLKDGEGFSFVPAEYPAKFLEAQAKYESVLA